MARTIWHDIESKKQAYSGSSGAFGAVQGRFPARKASKVSELIGDGRSFKVNVVIAGDSIDIGGRQAGRAGQVDSSI